MMLSRFSINLCRSNNPNLGFFSKGKLLRSSVPKTTQTVQSDLFQSSKSPNVRWYNDKRDSRETGGNTSGLYYGLAMAITTLGVSFAAVPLYRMFCQSTGYGGTTLEDVAGEKILKLKTFKDRVFKVRFNADTAARMKWNFQPEQSSIKLHPGETALAFYRAKNPTDRRVIGVSTYNVSPFEAGPYFNKIQCFCFDEQMLNPHEEVSLPVFFFLDPEIVDDPFLEHTTEIVLSYTFFEAKEGFKIPMPDFMKKMPISN